MSVSFVKAFHSSSTAETARRLSRQSLRRGVEGLGKTVYHMGDTDIFGDMALIEELYAPKMGFVPIGDRFTMDAQAAALACKKYFKFDTVMPMHYGTFPIIDQDPSKFIAEMAGQNVDVPEIGKPFAV